MVQPVGRDVYLGLRKFIAEDSEDADKGCVFKPLLYGRRTKKSASDWLSSYQF
jgi:hypothetical protein